MNVTVQTTCKHERRAPIPASRDPFINALLTRLPPRADGAERFWTSTWNSLSGALGVVVCEDGKHRVYRTHNSEQAGFYSAAPAGPDDPDGLWLWGWLHQVVHLDLATGELTPYNTSAVQALVFSGMPFDHDTGKILAVSFAPPRTVAVSFDVQNRRPGKVMVAPTSGHYMRQSFPNGDGTWSIVLHNPGERLLVWDPRTDALEEVVISERPNVYSNGTIYHLLRDERGHVYFPHRGWYDPRSRSFTGEGPRPREEMTWFGNLGDCAVGLNVQGATASVGLWDFVSGGVQLISCVPDMTLEGISLTASHKIIAVNLYGEYFRIDARTGALEYSRRLDTDAVGAVDAVCRVSEDRVIGSSYITQRFWETNLATGVAADNGRAAPGFGEVLRMQKVGPRVYMAAYNGGELLEFDPQSPARFPENPRVVADPPTGMRPTGICTDGRHVFYACSRNYGTLGSTLTRYDSHTGCAFDRINPVPDQQITSLCYDEQSHRLLAATTYHADCQSCPPNSDSCYVLTLDAESLEPLAFSPAPEGTVSAFVLGPASEDNWLFRCQGVFEGGVRDGIVALNAAEDFTTALRELQALPEGTREVYYSGRAGQFLLLLEHSIELWDLSRMQMLKVLYSGQERIQRIAVDDGALIIALPHEILLLERCLTEN